MMSLRLYLNSLLNWLKAIDVYFGPSTSFTFSRLGSEQRLILLAETTSFTLLIILSSVQCCSRGFCRTARAHSLQKLSFALPLTHPSWPRGKYSGYLRAFFMIPAM